MPSLFFSTPPDPGYVYLSSVAKRGVLLVDLVERVINRQRSIKYAPQSPHRVFVGEMASKLLTLFNLSFELRSLLSSEARYVSFEHASSLASMFPLEHIEPDYKDDQLKADAIIVPAVVL